MIRIQIVFLLFCTQILIGQTAELGGGVSKYHFSLPDDPRVNNSTKSDLDLSLFVSIRLCKVWTKRTKRCEF